MKIDIVAKSIEETSRFLAATNFKHHFFNVLLKYVKLHNSNVFVDFRFNSSDARGLFGYFSRRYGLSDFDLESVNKKFRRDKPVQLSSLSSKIDNAEKGIRNELSSWSKYKKEITDFSVKPKNDDSTYTKFLEMIDEEFRVETERLNKKKESLKKHRDIITMSRNSTRDLSNIFDNLELIYLSELLKVYTLNLEQYFKELFQTNTLYVKLNKKEIMKNFTERRKDFKSLSDQYDIDYSNLTEFERSLLGLLHHNKTNFTLVIRKDDLEYCIYKNGQYKVNKTNINSFPSNNDLDKIMMKYAEENPALWLTILSLHRIDDNFKKNEKLFTSIINFIRSNFPQEKLIEYDNLADAIRNEKERRKTAWEQSFRTNLDSTFPDAFPHLNFVVSKVQDMTYYLALGETKYDVIFGNISNDEMFVSFEKETSKENRFLA